MSLSTNAQILSALKDQYEACYLELKSATISQRFAKQYDEIKGGRVFVFDGQSRNLLRDLKKLKNDKSHDQLFLDTVESVKRLDVPELINYFVTEWDRVFSKLKSYGLTDDIQAIFIEYDYYYHYTSCIECYGRQAYPIVTTPRYISQEFDWRNKVGETLDAINFQPAWPNCDFFDSIDFYDASIEDVFVLHSRVLLHYALMQLEKAGKLDFLSARPVTFYVSAHDGEVMTLYLLGE
jgi:hypothetical protein